jgi:hypothetical protein
MVNAYHHRIAEVYENGVIQRRVCLQNNTNANAKIRISMLRKLHAEIKHAAYRNPENIYYIELKES